MNKKLYFPFAIGLLLLLVAVGYLAKTDVFGSADLVDQETAQSMADQTEEITQNMQETITEQLAGQTAGEQQLRLDSTTGRRLSQECTQWTELLERVPSDDNVKNREKSCTAFRMYVETGALPEDRRQPE